MVSFDKIHLFEEYHPRIQPENNEVIWTALIQAYDIHAQGSRALQVFNSMVRQNIKPNNSV
jgi:pentatricopeptide repeat protein